MLLKLILLPFTLVIVILKLVIGLVGFILKTIVSIFIVPILLIAGIAAVVLVVL